MDLRRVLIRLGIVADTQGAVDAKTAIEGVEAAADSTGRSGGVQFDQLGSKARQAAGSVAALASAAGAGGGGAARAMQGLGAVIGALAAGPIAALAAAVALTVNAWAQMRRAVKEAEQAMEDARKTGLATAETLSEAERVKLTFERQNKALADLEARFKASTSAARELLRAEAELASAKLAADLAEIDKREQAALAGKSGDAVAAVKLRFARERSEARDSFERGALTRQERETQISQAESDQERAAAAERAARAEAAAADARARLERALRLLAPVESDQAATLRKEKEAEQRLAALRAEREQMERGGRWDGQANSGFDRWRNDAAQRAAAEALSKERANAALARQAQAQGVQTFESAEVALRRRLADAEREGTPGASRVIQMQLQAIKDLEKLPGAVKALEESAKAIADEAAAAAARAASQDRVLGLRREAIGAQMKALSSGSAASDQGFDNAEAEQRREAERKRADKAREARLASLSREGDARQERLTEARERSQREDAEADQAAGVAAASRGRLGAQRAVADAARELREAHAAREELLALVKEIAAAEKRDRAEIAALREQQKRND